MNARRSSYLLSALLAFAAACGSSGGSPGPDAAPDLPRASDTPAVTPDGPAPADLPKVPDLPTPDAPAPTDVAPDVGGMDGTGGGIDTGSKDAPPAGQDGPVRETGAIDGTSGLDGSPTRSDTGITGADGPLDVAPDGFSPAPATALVVNSSNTATYNLGDGTWKVFYFDATAGQLYCVSELSGITRGYVSTSASVSPTNYLYATDGTTGTLAFTATATQRYYVAVAVSGGGASGSFQVADGGQLLALGANPVTLGAPNPDNYYFFRFPITKGHSYAVSVAGTSTTSVGLGLSPRAERAGNGQFQIGSGISGPLPITAADGAISSTSVDLSYSAFYYFFLRISTALSATVTIAQTS